MTALNRRLEGRKTASAFYTLGLVDRGWRDPSLLRLTCYSRVVFLCLASFSLDARDDVAAIPGRFGWCCHGHAGYLPRVGGGDAG